MSDLRHHTLSRGPEPDIQVWADEPQRGETKALVCLYIDGPDTFHAWDITPTEARTLAALLIQAAETQEGRTVPNPGRN